LLSGNIRQIGDEFPPLEREIFFLRAERILMSIPEIDSEEREAILALLRQKVPELSEKKRSSHSTITCAGLRAGFARAVGASRAMNCSA
jgi:hypothetical protein